MEVKDVLVAAIGYCWPVITAVVGYFLVRILSEIDIARADLAALKLEWASAKDFSADVKVIVKEWALVRKEMADSSAALTDAREKFEQIIILKRDRDSAFSRIDELRDELADLDKMYTERIHTLNARIASMRNSIEGLGGNITFEE